jgi:hypothetical protein
MTDRAFKFLADNTKEFQYVKGKLYIMTDTVLNLLEQFHAQCLPTDEEIADHFVVNLHKFIDINTKNKRDGACWCRDFVREEPKEEKKEAMPCITCMQNKILDHSLCSSCTINHIYWQAIPVDYKAKPTEKKEPTLEDEINALKDLLTELIKRNLK